MTLTFTVQPSLSPTSTREDGNHTATNDTPTLIMVDNRVTYRRQTPYNTRSNRVKIVKTPGGKLVYHHKRKPGTVPKCGDCGTALIGIKARRPREFANISKRQKTVQRAYGGSRCANCVHDRIIRAFLIEEQQVRLHLFLVETNNVDCQGSVTTTGGEELIFKHIRNKFHFPINSVMFE